VAIAVAYEPLTEEQQKRAMAVFEALDQDGSSTLDREELVKVTQAVGYSDEVTWGTNSNPDRRGGRDREREREREIKTY